MRITLSACLLLFSLLFFKADVRAQPVPQQTLFPGTTGAALLDSLVRVYKPSVTLTGQDAYRDTLYGAVERRPNDTVEDVYTGLVATISEGEDPSAAMTRQGINVEHTWPQSKGAGEENPLANSDLHHLFPAADAANSARSNNPFSAIPADEASDWWYLGEGFDDPRSGVPLAFHSRSTSARFEPRAVQQGNTARAMFYFYTMYRPEVNAADPSFMALQRETLRQWHAADPVDQAEYDRTFRVAAYQDDLPNPFVLDPTLVQRAYFDDAPPAPFAPGDVAIVGFDAVNPRDSLGKLLDDDFSFVTLVNLEAGDELFFTDNGARSDGTLRVGEGILRYTAPRYVAAGTAIRRSAHAADFDALSGGFRDFDLALSGDQILAFTVDGVGAARFLYGLNDEQSDWQDDATSSNTSALPPGLLNGQTAVALSEVDKAIYNGPTQGLTWAEFRIAISNPANWLPSGDSTQTLPNGSFLSELVELPVELVRFEAQADGDGAVLFWGTAGETNNAGFQVEHRPPSSTADVWREVGFVEGAGTTSDVRAYRFAVTDLEAGRHRFRLRQTDFDGTVQYSPEVEVALGVPDVALLSAPYPNPFRDQTRFAITVQQPQRVRVEVYDLLGRRVAQLFDGPLAAQHRRDFTFERCRTCDGPLRLPRHRRDLR